MSQYKKYNSQCSENFNVIIFVVIHVIYNACINNFKYIAYFMHIRTYAHTHIRTNQSPINRNIGTSSMLSEGLPVDGVVGTGIVLGTR
ncbi:hypothetical protein AB6846_22430, partial [Serratia proteamaculans]